MEIGLTRIAQKEEAIPLGIKIVTLLSLGENFFLHKRMMRGKVGTCYMPPKESLEQISKEKANRMEAYYFKSI